MTKGNERQRVMVNSSLRKALQKYVDSVCINYGVNDALIKSQKGGAFTTLTIVQLFARIYKLAGIEGASSHSGRRQFITTLAERQSSRQSTATTESVSDSDYEDADD